MAKTRKSKKTKKNKGMSERKLAKKLKKALKADWFKRNYPLRKTRRRWDMAYEMNGSKFLVEFDGPDHYTEVPQVKIDDQKDAFSKKCGFQTIRFPFWVMWDSETAKHFFGVTTDCKANFPHGFPNTEHVPATFCAPGVIRFRSELNSLPQRVRAEVVASLKKRAGTKEGRYVMPAFLLRELAAEEDGKAQPAS